jgi:hypothetical protein
MKYFLDTEFIENGRQQPLTLISIGMVDEHGRAFYAVSSEFDPAEANDWVKEHVLPQIEGFPQSTVEEIAAGLREFVGKDTPEFWGYYADYDWVILAQIFGRMIDLPKGWPMFCRDIKQLAMEWGNPRLPKQTEKEHNALADAQWNKAAYEFLMEKAKDFRILGKGSGLARITDERLRQIKAEGWTVEHDAEHRLGELAQAAMCYTLVANMITRWGSDGMNLSRMPSWPWDERWWKPSGDAVRNLEKAGALIAAEIDRILNDKKKPGEDVMEFEIEDGKPMNQTDAEKADELRQALERTVVQLKIGQSFLIYESQVDYWPTWTNFLDKFARDTNISLRLSNIPGKMPRARIHRQDSTPGLEVVR